MELLIPRGAFLLIYIEIVFVYPISDLGGHAKERMGAIRMASRCQDLPLHGLGTKSFGYKSWVPPGYLASHASAAASSSQYALSASGSTSPPSSSSFDASLSLSLSQLPMLTSESLSASESARTIPPRSGLLMTILVGMASCCGSMFTRYPAKIYAVQRAVPH